MSLDLAFCMAESKGDASDSIRIHVKMKSFDRNSDMHRPDISCLCWDFNFSKERLLKNSQTQT